MRWAGRRRFRRCWYGTGGVPTTYGIVERNTDAEWFSFYSNAGAISLDVNPLNIGPNLAIRAELYDANGARAGVEKVVVGCAADGGP